MSGREMIFLGRDNTLDWQLQADGVAVDLSSVTRMKEVAPVDWTGWRRK